MTRRLPCFATAAAVFALVAPAIGQTHSYVDMPVLVVIYTNYEKDADTYQHLTPEDVALVQEQVEEARLFFWRGSHMRCNLDITYLVLDRTLTPDQMYQFGEGATYLNWKCYDGVHSVRQDVLDAGYVDGDFASVFTYYAFQNDDENWAPYGGSAWWPYCGVLGPAGYVQTPMCWGVDTMYGYFEHEFSHEIDFIFSYSGDPDDMYHADQAHLFPYADDGGHHFNFLLSYTLDPGSWLQLGSNWVVGRSAPDVDQDGVPDSGDLPVTEALLGSSPLLVDSDDDGLNDYDEILATYHDMADPTNPDSDGDGLRDGEDPYPLYRTCAYIEQRTPTLDGHIDNGEYTLLAEYHLGDPDLNASYYASWSEDTLYFAVRRKDDELQTYWDEIDWVDNVEVLIDTGADGWFIDSGTPNYRFRMATRTSLAVDADEYYYDPEDEEDDLWHAIDASSIQYAFRKNRLGESFMEFAAPLSLAPELSVGLGQSLRIAFGTHDADSDGAGVFSCFNDRRGDWNAFVNYTLTSRPGDLNCDGVVNAFDIDPFVTALVNPETYAAAHPNCQRSLADVDGDGAVNAFDIDPFVQTLIGG